MNVKLQRKIMNAYVLMYLQKRKYVLYKAEKDPAYWITAQQKSLKKFVKYIYQIPFYRERFEASNVKPEDIKTGEDLRKLPVLTKEEYREWLLEQTKDKEKYKYWMSRNTTGSSGTPLTLYSLPTDRASEIANLFRCAILQKKGYHALTDRVFSTMVPKPKAGKKFSIPYNKQMSSISTPEELVEGYNAAKPDFYYGNKTAVLMIAQYAVENNIPLHKAKCVGSISEALDENARRIIDQAFGSNTLFDIYGCAECGNFAVEKRGEPGVHIVWSDTHVINLVNETEVEGKPGYKTGQLAITSLAHYGFPMVNYILGDTVEIKEENGVKYITKILGRTNDVIKNRDGSSYQWMHVNRVMFGITDITQFRVVQKSYEQLEFILAAKDATIERKKEVEDMIKDRVALYLSGSQGENKKVVSFEWCDRIKPDPTGKIRILISEV